MMDAVRFFDHSVLSALFSVREPGLTQFFVWVTQLGEPWFIATLTLCALLVLFRTKQYAEAAGLSISVASASLAIFLLKGFIERGRPPLAFQAYVETWYSFPSAHSALSIAFYGFVAYLAWQRAPSTLTRYGTLALAATILLLVPFSRLYLGVHYLSDVVSGLLVGATSLSLGVWWVRFAKV